MNVELKPYAEMSNSRGEQKTKAYHVYANGERVGYVCKQQDTRTCSFPWRAFGRSVAGSPTPVVGNFTTAEGGKRAAVAAVVAAAK